MKVGVYIIQDINPSAGGNFSYYEKLIAAIDSYSFNTELEICYVGRISKKKVKLNRPYLKLAPHFVYRVFRILDKLKITKFFSLFFSANSDLCNRFDVACLKKNNIDVLLYPKQFFREVENFPFMTMNWDAGHKSTFMFPEFLEGYEVRENWYRVDMQKALAVIVESQSSKREFSEYFSIDENRLEIVPLFPGGVVDLTVDDNKQDEVLKNFGLQKLSYFYYPAQFWAHKNHFNLILAFKKLVDNNKGRDLKLVFTGSEKGNKDYIRSVIKENNLDSQILMLGFVSNDEVFTLYKNAIALVMPTFLGPTNMPVLEAQDLQTAVICSDLKGHRETCGDGAFYAAPDKPDEWHTAMQDVLDEKIRTQLVDNAKRVRATSIFNIQHAVKSLEEILVKFIPIRRTFK